MELQWYDYPKPPEIDPNIHQSYSVSNADEAYQFCTELRKAITKICDQLGQPANYVTAEVDSATDFENGCWLVACSKLGHFFNYVVAVFDDQTNEYQPKLVLQYTEPFDLYQIPLHDEGFWSNIILSFAADLP